MSIRSFSDEEMAMLSRVIRREKQSIQNPRSRPPQDRSYDENQDWLAPEVYVARILATIDPLEPGAGTGTGSNDHLGYGRADIYRIVTGSATRPYLTKALATDQRVYNITTSPLTVDDYKVVVRDKYGHWVVLALGNIPVYARFRIGTEASSPGTGTGTDVVSGSPIAFDRNYAYVLCDRLDESNDVIEFDVIVYGTYTQSVYVTDMIVWAVWLNSRWEIRDEGKRIWRNAYVVEAYGDSCLVNLEPESMFGSTTEGPQVTASPSAPTGSTVLVVYSVEPVLASADVGLYTIIDVSTCGVVGSAGTGTGTTP